VLIRFRGIKRCGLFAHLRDLKPTKGFLLSISAYLCGFLPIMASTIFRRQRQTKRRKSQLDRQGCINVGNMRLALAPLCRALLDGSVAHAVMPLGACKRLPPVVAQKLLAGLALGQLAPGMPGGAVE
jgi:hypothetical protein